MQMVRLPRPARRQRRRDCAAGCSRRLRMPARIDGRPRCPGRLFSHRPLSPRTLSLLGKGRDSEARFRALVESSADHIFMLSPDGTFLFSNDRVLQFGMRAGREVVGRRLQDLHPPDVCSLYREKVREVLADGRVVTFAHRRESDKGPLHYQNTLFPIRRGRLIRALGGICRDMSEQEKIEKQLVQAQKMEALGTLVAGAAHEINNPVNLIQFNLPLLEKVWRDLEPMLDALAEHLQNKKFGGLSYGFIRENMLRLIADMDMATHRVARIVTGLKQFARRSNPADKTDIQVNTAVENAARLAASTLSKSKTELQLELAPDLPFVQANLVNLEQIVLNLMINALQSIHHDRGRVKITTAWRAEDQIVTIEVADNGRGINPAVQDKIFDPFVTDRQAQGGTGLGLSVTYNLVKAHQGEIAFDSRPGQGTRFTVQLPTVHRRRARRVMVVDDDDSFRSMVMRLIARKTGCVTEGFSDGAEALIRLGGNPPDVLVLDMFMPRMDGLGVCKAIKNELGLDKTRVVIVTGFPHHPQVAAAERMGFTQIALKPLDVDRFMGMIKDNLDEKPA